MGDADDCRKILSEMSKSRRVLVYLAYAHVLTTLAREFYDDSDFRRLRAYNETIHGLTGHLFGLQSGTIDSASEQSFAEALVAGAEARGWLGSLKKSITVIA
jgi:hypothetical protein